MVEYGVQVGYEYVVIINDGVQYGDCYYGVNSVFVLIGRFLIKERDEVVYNFLGWENEDVNFWVFEDLKEVLEENGIVVVLCVGNVKFGVKYLVKDIEYGFCIQYRYKEDVQNGCQLQVLDGERYVYVVYVFSLELNYCCNVVN